MNILEQYWTKIRFEKDGRIRCLSRNKLIERTPEEEVRQATVAYLMDQEKVAQWQIELEYPLSRFIKGAYGFADIVVFNGETPILLVELKANDVFITEDIFNHQARGYAEVLNPDITWVSNGQEHLFYKMSSEGFTKIDIPKSSNSLFSNFSALSQTFEALPILSNADLFRVEKQETYMTPNPAYLSNFWFTKKAENSIRPLIIRLGETIYCNELLQPNETLGAYTILKNHGLQLHSAGDASGGRITDYFRHILLEDSQRQELSIAMALGMYNGISYLRFMLPDDSIRRNVLELKLNDMIFLCANEIYELYHSGRINTAKNSYPLKFRQYMLQKGWQQGTHKKGILIGKVSKNAYPGAGDDGLGSLWGHIIQYVMDVNHYKELCKANKIEAPNNPTKVAWLDARKKANKHFKAGEIEAGTKAITSFIQTQNLSNNDLYNAYLALRDLHGKYGYSDCYKEYHFELLKYAAPRRFQFLREEFTAKLYDAFGDIEECKKQASSLLKDSPDSIYGHEYYGLCLIAEFREQEALPYIETAYQKEPSRYDLKFLLLRCSAVAKQDRLSVEEFREVSQRGHDLSNLKYDFEKYLDSFYYYPLEKAEEITRFLGILSGVKQYFKGYYDTLWIIGQLEFIYDAAEASFETAEILEALEPGYEEGPFLKIQASVLLKKDKRARKVLDDQSKIRDIKDPTYHFWAHLAILAYYKLENDKRYPAKRNTIRKVIQKDKVSQKANEFYLAYVCDEFEPDFDIKKRNYFGMHPRELNIDLFWIDKMLGRNPKIKLSDMELTC